MSARPGLQRKPETSARGTGKAAADDDTTSASSGVPRYLAPVQLECDSCNKKKEPDKYAKPKPLIGESEAARDRVVQQDGEGAAAPAGATGIQGMASQGVAQASQPMPGFDRIQASFGRHDISGVQTQVGGPAQQASEGMGARAYTVGNRVGFKSEPDLHLAAHEAAHVVQQRRGVRLKDGVGRQGDQYEQQADAVADRVVAGQSAEHLLDQNDGGEATQALQHKCSCGGSGCSKCGGGNDDEAVQMELDVNATRLFEDAVAGAAVPDSSAESKGKSAGAEAEPGDGSATDSSKADGEETEEGGADAASSSSGSSGGGGGGGGPSAGPAAPAAPGAAPSAPASAPAAPAAPGGGGGGGTATATAGACSGGGTAQCYHEPSEEPEEEPEETPPNPEPTHTEAETSDEGEEDAPEVDDCSAQQADAGVPAEGGGAPAAPGAAPAGGDAAAPVAASGAGPADASAAPGGGGGDGGGAAEAPMQSVGSPLDGAIAQVEGQRSAAVASYGASSAALTGASDGTRALRSGTQFAASSGGSSADAMRRDTASGRADRFFAGAADRLDQSIAFASQQAPDQLGAQAESTKAQIAASIETQKLAISGRIDMARGQARGDASMARRAVNAQADAFIADAQAETDGAIETLTATHADTMGQVDELETTTLESVNQLYADGRTDLESLGTTIGNEATATGETFAATYRGFRHCTENGFWDGDLSERRSMAQEDAARSVASGYHDRIIESASKRAREVTKEGRKKDRCAIISSASVSRDTLDTQLANLISALEGAREATIQQAESTRAGLLSSIDSSLGSTLRQLDQQEHDQRQAADDTGYMQQVLQEQIAHSAAAGLQRAVSDAATSVQSALFQVQAQFATSEAPDPDRLDEALSQVTQNLDSALGGLQTTIEGGAGLAVEQLASAAQQGLSALDSVTQTNDQMTAAVSGGFSSSMSGIAGTDNFAEQRAGFTQQIQQSTDAGSDALMQVLDGMQGGCDSTLEAAAKTLAEAHTGLEQNLNQSKQGIECEIASKADEAASHEAPAWKMLVAILLVIIVIVIVIAVIVASGGAAMAALVAAAGPIGAGIIVGAAVGAVTSGLLAVASNLWNNRSWSKGVLHAMAVGAITGAIGGGLGAGVGLAFKGAAVAVQLGAQVVTAVGMDVATQFVTNGFSFEHFSWTSLGMTTLITVLTFGIGHAVSSSGARPGEVPTTEPNVTEPNLHTTEPTPAAGASAEPTPAATPETVTPTTSEGTAPIETPTAPEPVPAAPESTVPAPTEPSAPPAAPPEAAAPASTPEATAPAETPAAPAETPAAPAETPAAAPESTAAPAEPTPGEPAQPATAEEAATLENTAGKNADELSPAEALTEREVAARGEPEPINEPPFTTERELANGHEVKETPDGEFFERCSDGCVVFDRNGNPVMRGGASAGPEGVIEHPVGPAPEVETRPVGGTPEGSGTPEPLAPPESSAPTEPTVIDEIPEDLPEGATSFGEPENTPEMHAGEVEDIFGSRDQANPPTSGSTSGPERAQAAIEAEEFGPHGDDMAGNEAEIGSAPSEERPSEMFDDPEGPAPRSGEALNRPALREELMATVEANADTNAQGQFVDGDGNVIVEPDYGHIPGRENRRIIAAGEELGLTQEQLSDFVNSRPDYFQIEEHVVNISHENEIPGIDGYEEIVDDMRIFFRM